jgi:hypothetical protein
MGTERKIEITAPLAVEQPTPEAVDALSRELDIPHNMMFIGSLTHTQGFSIQDLGGVRIIW